MNVYLFEAYLKTIREGELTDSDIVSEVESVSDLHRGVIKVNGRLAVMCMLDQKSDRIFIEWVDEPKGKDEACYTDEIECPHCQYKNSDSWECSDSEDNEECGNCGSIFSYVREVSVTYSSKIVDRNDGVLELREIIGKEAKE